VNADDDNGSAVTNGIPATRDFSATNLPAPDPELQVAIVDNTCPTGGTYSVWATQNATSGQVSFWQDPQKQAALAATFADPPLHNFSFYIEGDHESQALNDVTINVQYTWTDPVSGNPVTSTPTSQLTVTPVINSFNLTPAGGAAGQNVKWAAGANGNSGLAIRLRTGWRLRSSTTTIAGFNA
jgi:hypothetical protein